MEKAYQGACHCGRVKFEVVADIEQVRVCDCSVCKKRGALIYRVEEQNICFNTPLGDLTVYKWGTFTGKDYFCPVCGIMPFRRPSAPTDMELAEGVKPFDGWAVNTRCLEGFDIASVPRVEISGSKI
ncbi:MAG TPA: GFA family protein [Devosia sp.]|nr:GFA family protein [Devosia sp.]